MIVITCPLRLPPRRKATLVALYRLALPTPWGLGYSPSIREIMYEVGGRSTSAAWRDLVALDLMGLVTRSGQRVRSRMDARNWCPNYERLIFITQDGVTDVRERQQAADR